MNIYLEPGTTNVFVLSPESPGEGYEHIGEVSNDASLTPVIPDEIYTVIAAYNENLLSTGFEIITK
ncbi:hypothetical protein RAL96_15385 [Klebsiella variicola]|uniref:hypothetical protein n=1 Tax=Klebsiella pneumoniae complex TaxID=3390273 RepID=UPI001BCDCC68|nr:hypothetical protein [Klebsiella pneumoniae]MDX6872179.1 hypothetical protein [Klebsiella pneumoniae]HBR3019935.1 hypothetical protein [Klebsiella pneumoniae]HBS6939048.1 hypothetical protein [Klebsiella pneumoniae]HBV1008381.1 hypothetical protein [Klebsiella pneumoniae]HBX3280349.1 hypothetical protein [Klebsiella pneumoniae]